MKDYEFIQENSNIAKIWTLVISVIILSSILIASIFFSTAFYQILSYIPFFQSIVNFFTRNIENLTLWGLFYAHFLGGLFFIPSPDEIIFYYSLLKGNNYFFALIFSISGYMIAQVANYYAGEKMSSLIMNLLSKKKVYDARRFVNKYGPLGIFLFNFLPFPGPLLTFSLGLAKYNFTRLFVITVIGQTCKYIALIFIFLLLPA